MNNIEELIAEYKDEIGIATSTFFAWKAINDIAANDRKIFLALNSNAASWIVISNSLLATFYVALGRIFDEDKRSLTLCTFVSKCKSQIAQFSKSALEARKLKDSHGGVRPEWLDSFLQNAYEPVLADFDELAEIAEKHKAIYISNYKDIRRRIFAHKDLVTIGSKDAMFAKTNIEEIQEMLEFIYQAGRVVEELYKDGQKTNLTDYVLNNREQYVRDDLESLLHKLPVG